MTRTNAYLLRAGQFSSTDLSTLDGHFVEQLRLFPELTGLAIANEAGAFLNVARSDGGGFSIRQRNVTATDGLLYRYRTDSNGQNAAAEGPARSNYDPHRDPPMTPGTRRPRRPQWPLAAGCHPGKGSRSAGAGDGAICADL